MGLSSLQRKLEIARRTAGPAGTPRFASLFVTRKCNLTCPYCRSIRQPFQDIDLLNWKRCIDRLHRFGCRLFTLTGGEPLVRKDLPEIVAHISREQKAVCWLISNFGLMSTAVIDSLSQAGLQFLTCSLDSLAGEGGKGDPHVLDLLSYAKSKGIICSTLTVVTNENIEQVPQIVETVTRRGIIFDMGLFQHVGGLFSPARDSLKPSMDQVDKLRRFLVRKKLLKGLVAPSWGYLHSDLDLYRNMMWRCSAGRDKFLVVNNNGSMMACQEHDTGIDLLSIESLDDKRWRMAKREAVDGCGGCFYGCYFQKENIGLFDVALDAWTMLRI